MYKAVVQGIQDIFTKVWPSVRALAEDINEEYDTVLRWRLKKRIPQDAWPKVIAKSAARNQPITADQLLSLCAPMKQRGRPAHKRRRRDRKTGLRVAG